MSRGVTGRPGRSHGRRPTPLTAIASFLWTARRFHVVNDLESATSSQVVRPQEPAENQSGKRCKVMRHESNSSAYVPTCIRLESNRAKAAPHRSQGLHRLIVHGRMAGNLIDSMHGDHPVKPKRQEAGVLAMGVEG